MLRPTFSVSSPLRSCGMPQANSTTSMPRVISPLASSKVLPCSAVMMAARRSSCACSASRNLKRIAARRSGGVSDHAGKAAFAAATAVATSAALANATRALRSPRAGFQTSPKTPDVPSTRRPLMKWPIVVVSRVPGEPCCVVVVVEAMIYPLLRARLPVRRERPREHRRQRRARRARSSVAA